MPDLIAKRTLVKSPPELWNELSEVDRLARHLEAFGEIRITKLEPERTVAWEGEAARGTVSIEPSGWGTKVTLTARLPEEAPTREEPQRPEEAEVASEVTEPAAAESATAAPPDAPPAPRRGFLARLFGRSRPGGESQADASSGDEAAAEAEPVDEPPVATPPVEEPAATEPAAAAEPEPPAPEPAATAVDPGRAQAVLDDALDALGSAHHRPFSRG